MKKNITLITGNLNKAKQFSRYIPIKHHKLDLDEIQSLDIDEVITHKAKQAYEILKTPVLVDDVSLQINALGKLPGTFIKFFIEELGREGLCQLIQPYKDKSALATVALGYYDGEKLKIIKTQITGRILDKPRGDKGYGWDALVLLDDFNKTYGEMETEELDKASIRNKAVQQLKEYLENEK